MDIGLKGGFTVDSSTVDFVTSPIKTIAETYAAVEKGYEDAKRTSADIYAESIIIYEKAGNLISYGVFGLDGDFEVQNARVRDQLERYGIELSFDGEAGLYKGRTIKLENGILIRVELDNGLWNTSEVTLFLQGDRGNGGIIGALNSAGQAMNEWGARRNQEISNSSIVRNLNYYGDYMNRNPQAGLLACFGGAAIGAGVPIIAGTAPTWAPVLGNTILTGTIGVNGANTLYQYAPQINQYGGVFINGLTPSGTSTFKNGLEGIVWFTGYQLSK